MTDLKKTDIKMIILIIFALILVIFSITVPKTVFSYPICAPGQTSTVVNPCEPIPTCAPGQTSTLVNPCASGGNLRTCGPGEVSTPVDPCSDGVTDPGPGGGGNTDDGGGGNTEAGGSLKFDNPLQSESIIEFILKIIDVLLIFAVPIIVLFIMYGGLLFVTARGAETQITKAKSVLLWAIVGGVIALGAKLIIEVIQGTIQAF